MGGRLGAGQGPFDPGRAGACPGSGCGIRGARGFGLGAVTISVMAAAYAGPGQAAPPPAAIGQNVTLHGGTNHAVSPPVSPALRGKISSIPGTDHLRDRARPPRPSPLVTGFICPLPAQTGTARHDRHLRTVRDAAVRWPPADRQTYDDVRRRV